MNVAVFVEKESDIEKANSLFSMFRFPTYSVTKRDPDQKITEGQNSSKQVFCIDVFDGESDFKAKDLETKLCQGSCNLLIFNEDAGVPKEPKVIFATDHSDQAGVNLDRFKSLKPAGFLGATVISDSGTSGSEVINQETTLKFLEQTKKAVQTSQANLIIANFDLKNLGKKSALFTTIMKLVLQNRCHVLILTSY